MEITDAFKELSVRKLSKAKQEGLYYINCFEAKILGHKITENDGIHPKLSTQSWQDSLEEGTVFHVMKGCTSGKASVIILAFRYKMRCLLWNFPALPIHLLGLTTSDSIMILKILTEANG